MPKESDIKPEVSEQFEPDVRFAFILSPDFTLLPFAGFIDAVRHCADERDYSRQVYCHWSCVGPNLDPVRSSCGIEVAPWEEYSDEMPFDYIVVIGGRLQSFYQHHEDTFAYVKHAYGSGIPIIGLCTGSFVMAEAGLMDGVRCAVHAVHTEDLVSRYPKVIPIINEMYVSERGLVTCPGGAAAIDLAVDVLSKHCGPARGTKAISELVVDQHRESRHIGQLPFEYLQRCGDWRVEQAITLMKQSMTSQMSTEELAAKLSISRRQLDRAFQTHVKRTPKGLWREIRLEHSRWRLLNSSKTITQIAHECGFTDSAHFVRWFKRVHKQTPREYRQSRKRDFWSSDRHKAG